MESKKILIAVIIFILVSSIVLIRRNKHIDCRYDDFDIFSTDTTHCPVDCRVGEFGEFSRCTRECGGGTKTRIRTVVVPPVGGGAACPPLAELTETVECNTQVCPVDCVVGEFRDTSACSRRCGGGFKTRTREVLVPPAGEGAACPRLTETVECGTECIRLTIITSSTVSLFSDISCNLNGGSLQFSTITREIGTLTVNGGGNVGAIQSVVFNANITSTGIEPYMIFGLFIKRRVDAAVTKFISTRFIDVFGGAQGIASPISLSFDDVRDIQFLTGDVIGVYIQGCERRAQYGLDRISIIINYGSLTVI